MEATDWISFGHHGFSHYRIWTRPNGAGAWQQRHEWKRDDGSIRMDDWITTAHKLVKNSRPIN